MAKINKKKAAPKMEKKKIYKPVKKKKILVKKVKSPSDKIVKKVSVKKNNSAIKLKNKIVSARKTQTKKIIKEKISVKNKTVAKNVIKKITKTKAVLKKKNKNSEVKEFAAESLFKARIKVIGIGGGGGSIVSEIGRSLEKANFVVADTDMRALKRKSGFKYFLFGQELTHGLGTGVNVDLAKQAAESAKDKLSGIFKDQDIIIFIASLGGGLGSGATQVFAEAAREFGGITFGIFTMPFKFEGKNKQRIAQNALKILKKSLNVSLVIPNEKIFKIIDANTAITDAFSIVNKSLIESLESLIDLIYNPGIINIDFADLRTILRGRGNTAFLNTIEESGKTRAESICQKILVNPLLQNSDFEAEKILFNVAGSENLSMFEVERISSYISSLNPKAKIIFGISKNPKLKNKIKTTILMTGGQVAEDLLIKEEPETIKITEPKEAKDEKKPVEIEVQVIKEISEAKSKNPEIKNTKKAVKQKSKKIKKPEAKPQNKIKADAKKDKSDFDKKAKDKKQKILDNKGKEKKEEKQTAGDVLRAPEFELPILPVPVANKARMNIIETIPSAGKKNIRRSGLEIRKAEEQEAKKRMAQEKEWEIPAFLRRVKFKN